MYAEPVGVWCVMIVCGVSVWCGCGVCVCVCVIVGVDSVWCVMCVHGDKSVVYACTCTCMYTTASGFWNDNALLGILQDCKLIPSHIP